MKCYIAFQIMFRNTELRYTWLQKKTLEYRNVFVTITIEAVCCWNAGGYMIEKIGLSERLEDYLEIILALEKTNKVARVKDIADQMGVLRGSVTGALKTLAAKGMIHYKPYSFITLTRRGTTIAREITRRHAVIKDFLLNVLRIDAEKADVNACRMEHAMDKAVVDRLVRFIEHIHSCPRTGDEWIRSFVNYHADGRHNRKECNKCLEQLIARYQKNPAILYSR